MPGDRVLVERSGWGRSSSIHEVLRVTPTGKIVVNDHPKCPSTFDQSGRKSWQYGYDSLRQVTPEVEADLRHRRRVDATCALLNMSVMSREKVKALTIVQLDALIELLVPLKRDEGSVQ